MSGGTHRRKRAALIAIALAAAVLGGSWWSRGPITSRPGPAEERARRGTPSAAEGAPLATTTTKAGPRWRLQAGVAPRRIAGRVLAGDQPAPGAEVRLRAGALGGDPVSDVVVRADPTGRFDFGLRPAMTYTLAGSLAEHAPTVMRVNLADPTTQPPPDRLELRLQLCHGVVFGEIMDNSGGPIAGATLRIAQMAGTESLAEGTYALCVGPGSSEVRVDAAGYGSKVMVVASSSRTQRDLVLLPEGVVEGVVVTKQDRRPVPDARVVAHSLAPGFERPPSTVAVTDDAGRFRLVGMSPGKVRLWAGADRLALVDTVQATVVAGETTESPAIELVATVTVAGHVREAGKPLAGAEVRINAIAGDAYSQPATSQADGAFSIGNVVPGSHRVLVAGSIVRVPTTLQVEVDRSIAGLEVEVSPMASVSGRVTRGGRPVADAAVRTGNVQTLSGSDGTYRLRGLAGGRVRLLATSDREGAYTESSVTLEDGEARQGVDLELTAGGRIEGLLVDERGTPVTGASLIWTHAETGDQGRCASDASGAFRCALMTGGGTYRPSVFASASSSASSFELVEPKAIRLSDGSSRVDVGRLVVRREAGEVEGVVVDAAGTGVPDVAVEAVRDGGAGSESMTHTDGEGHFRLGIPTAGSYTVRARSPGGASARADRISSGMRSLRLRLRDGGRLDGRLAGFGASPVLVQVRRLDAEGLVPATVTGDAFRAVGLEEGRYLVVATSTAGGASRVIEISGAVPTEVILRADGTGTIEGGVVELGTGEPVQGLRCGAWPRSGTDVGIGAVQAEALVSTDAHGHFTLRGAPAGELYVRCLGNGSFSAGEAFSTLPRGGRIVLRLVSARRTLGVAASTIGARLDGTGEAIVIVAISPGGPAASAGLQRGDVVHRVDGVSVAGVGAEAVRTAIEERPAGTKVSLEVSRNGEGLGPVVVETARP